MFDLGAKVQITPHFWSEHRLHMLKDDPDLKEDSVLTIKRRGKLRLTFEETNIRMPLSWVVPADGVTLNQEGKRVCRRDIDEAAARVRKMKGLSQLHHYYTVGSSILREIGMEARGEMEEIITHRRGLVGCFRHPNHPLSIWIVSSYSQISSFFWMGVTLQSDKFEDFVKEENALTSVFRKNREKRLKPLFPDLKVFEVSNIGAEPNIFDTHEGWDMFIDHLRQACEG